MTNSLKIYPLLFLLMITLNDLLAQMTAIPDVLFEEALIDLGIDSGTPDGLVLTADINTIRVLDLRGPDLAGGEITDLTGIEDFAELLYLNFENHKVSQLDISKNILLTELHCTGNELTSLSLEQNPDLRLLYCAFNQITDLEVSNNLELSVLYCGENDLTELDVSDNVDLSDLQCNGNQLQKIDVTNNAKLLVFNCNANLMNEVDVSQNLNLRTFVCSGNLLSTIDVSQNLLLSTLGCDFNELTALDVSKNEALKWLYCVNNKIEIINFPENSALSGLYCWNNQLTHLDLSNFPDFQELYCRDNELLCLNVKNGNNHQFLNFSAENNPFLTCIEVDDAAFSTSNWPNVDAAVSFRQFCGNNCSVGTIDLVEELQADLFPNPTNGNITIDFGETIEAGRLFLYNSIGQEISTQNFARTHSLNLDLNQTPGIYVLQLQTSTGATKVFKILQE